MIDPDCRVCLGWVCESHPQRAWTDELGCQCGVGIPCECQWKNPLRAEWSRTVIRWGRRGDVLTGRPVATDAPDPAPIAGMPWGSWHRQQRRRQNAISSRPGSWPASASPAPISSHIADGVGLMSIHYAWRGSASAGTISRPALLERRRLLAKCMAALESKADLSPSPADIRKWDPKETFEASILRLRNTSPWFGFWSGIISEKRAAASLCPLDNFTHSIVRAERD